MRTALKPVFAATVLAAVGALACGCGSRFARVDAEPGDLAEGQILPGPAEIVTGYGPARLEVYPLSRLEGAGESRRAVLHLRLQDAFSHDVKWPGVVRIELAPQAEGVGLAGTGSSEGTRLFHVDLTPPELNAAAFDTISRCYALRVPAPGEGPVRASVRWVLQSATGRSEALTAEGVLEDVR